MRNKILFLFKLNCLFFMFFLIIPSSYAGVSLGATRIIFPSSEKQITLPVNTNLESDHFLIQSWIENSTGEKDNNFFISPPLFMMEGKKENNLRIFDKSLTKLPSDRESLFWINVKAIPSSDKKDMDKNILQFSVTSKIKMFYRPENLNYPLSEAPNNLAFKFSPEGLIVKNPTPLFLTLIEISLNNEKLDNVMVPPFEEVILSPKQSHAGNGKISFSTINDYGAKTDEITKTVN